MKKRDRIIAGKNYTPLDDIKYEKFYQLYSEFCTALRATESDTLYKEYSRMRNKYEARLLVALGVLTKKQYDTMTF